MAPCGLISDSHRRFVQRPVMQSDTRTWYECDDAVIAPHTYPRVLIELALSRGVDPTRLLAGTRIESAQALVAPLSPYRMLRLISNAQRLLPGHDSSFLFGHRLLPSNHSELAVSLMSCANLAEALELLVRTRVLASPLLAPRLRKTHDGAEIQWVDAIGLESCHQFVVEALCAALTSVSNWLCGRKLPWHYSFRHAPPNYSEQYEVHLNSDLHFSADRDCMRIDNDALQWPWLQHSAVRKADADHALNTLLLAMPYSDGFRSHLWNHLYAKLRDSSNLDSVAYDFAMSPATLKRKLKKHGCTFQSLSDDVRRQVCINLLAENGYTNEQAAAHLNFSDLTNFRRAFKRWTGMTPSEFRTNGATPS